MGDLEKMQPRPFKRDFFELLTVVTDARLENRSTMPREDKMDAASRRLYLMSFKRHGEIYPKRRGADPKTDAPGSSLLDEFPAGYSLTGCSPALPASALPAGVDYAAGLAQVGGHP